MPDTSLVLGRAVLLNYILGSQLLEVANNLFSFLYVVMATAGIALHRTDNMRIREAFSYSLLLSLVNR